MKQNTMQQQIVKSQRLFAGSPVTAVYDTSKVITQSNKKVEYNLFQRTLICTRLSLKKGRLNLTS